MPLRLQIFIAIIILVFLLYIVNKVRKKKIDLRYALSWLFMGFIVLILDIFPGIIVAFSELVGISLASNTVFFLGIVLLIILIFSLAVSVSNLSNKNKRLTQEIALLREEVERIKNED